MDPGRLHFLIMPQLSTILLCAALLASCGGSKAAPPKEYQLRGEVVRLDPQVRVAAIKHGKIEGWMEAMTMEFPVHDAKEYQKLAVGKQVTATVYVTDDSYWIGNIQPAP
jgi:Cu/Ag efflux protein CusF